ncbi:hypothetical protein DIE28_10670 [Paracoccus thiocyanatus]|uniref:Periplasmic heavy metal sensor n=2 Tax=Paracoccus thiocyanatus TaxID=34006 RepID=A0A3D8PCC4_9RHOB|nr:hypothetical protein DIE28_10670 [Paracoccus thiocyanatus]
MPRRGQRRGFTILKAHREAAKHGPARPVPSRPGCRIGKKGDMRMEHVTGKSRRRIYLWGGLAALLILAALATAAAVRADGFRGHGMGGAFRGMMLERALKSVEASDDQRQQIWTILDAARAEIRPMASALDDRRGRLADLMAAPELDRAAVEALRQEVMATADAASLRASQALLDAAEVLTPEQRAALVAKRRDMGREMGRGFGPGRF